MLRTLLVVMILLAAINGSCEAVEVYRWTDANGVIHFSDRRPANEDAERVAIADQGNRADPRDGAGRDLAGAATARAVTPAAKPPTPRAIARNILMYDDPACGYCRKAERWFKANGLAFRSIDVTASKRNHDRFVRAGGRGTPLIFVDGKPVSGFNEDRLRYLVFGR